MRAALLPTPGEPFMLSYWLRNFETWRSEVDELFVLINGRPESATMVDGRVMTTANPIGHGPAIDWLLELTKADYIVLCEDDAYVRHPEVVGQKFVLMENGVTDIFGSPRYEDTVDRYEDWTSADPLSQALWPAFLFAKRDDLLGTDREFGDRIFYLGETVPGIGPVTAEMCAFVGVAPNYIHVDTLYATTYQLRDKRIELVHRVRVLQAEATEDWIKYDPPWFHVSGLSAIGYVLAGQTTNLPDYGPDGGLWPRRVAWWERTYREADASLRNSAYGQSYRERLDHFRDKALIPARLVDEWDARFDGWAA